MKKTMKLFGMAALIMVASTVANAEKIGLGTMDYELIRV